MKKVLIAFLLSISSFLTFLTFAQSEVVNIEVFVRDGCTHCEDEEVFFENLKTERNDFEVIYKNIGEEEHSNLFDNLTELENISKVTPISIVGNTVIVGFSTAETTGKQIINLIEQSKGKETYGFEEYIKRGGSDAVPQVWETCDEDEVCEINNSYFVDIPFIGAVDVGKYSLGAMSVVLGFVDGFNPCAMWVLIMFLTFLVEVGSRKKMFQLAGIFILAETIMYYLIMNVWLTTWNFVKLDNIVTPIVGVIAVCAGAYFIYDAWVHQGVCKLIGFEQKKKVKNRLKFITETELTVITFFAILGVAFSVNVVEFACSVGIPQTFTKILDINMISGFTKQIYLLIYILFYMIDDFIVFGIALYSFEKIGITTSYAKYAHFIGGALMLALGLILLINPEMLVF
jgi:cytochrome c biogenesis protein CcdA/glutaredoxin